VFGGSGKKRPEADKVNVAEWSIRVKSTPLEFVQAIMAELSVTERTLLGYFGHPACRFSKPRDPSGLTFS